MTLKEFFDALRSIDSSNVIPTLELVGVAVIVILVLFVVVRASSQYLIWRRDEQHGRDGTRRR